MSKEFERKVIKDLIEFYKLYIEGANTKILQEKAEEIQSKYIGSSPLLSEFVYGRITQLVDFYVDTGIKPPTKEEAKKLVETLEKRT